MNSITVDSLIDQLQKQLDDHKAMVTKLTGALEVVKSLKAQGFTTIVKQEGATNEPAN